jgi:hypothetical protein
MVRFGKVDVKGDYCRTGLAQLVDELCNDGARPGLLADFAEALVVDIDDADWRVARFSWGGLLIEVTANQGQPLDQIGGGDAQGERDE